MNRCRPFAIAASLVAAAWSLSLPAAAEVTVGVVLSLTGAGSSQGIPESKLIALLPPRLGGEPVRYVVLDDATDPTQALKNARKLVADQVDVLLGASITPNAVAIAQVALESRTPQVSPAPMDVPAAEQPWVFVVPQSADLMIGAVLEHMSRQGIKTVGYIGYAQSWGDQVWRSLTTLGPQYGIKAVNDERFQRTDTTVMAQALKTAALKPDAILIGATGTPAVLPHVTLRERGYQGPIYHTHGVVNDDFLRVGGAKVEGAYAPIGPVVVWKELPDSDAVKKVSADFAALYAKAYGAAPVNAFATWAYDSYLLLDRAVAVAAKKTKPGTTEFRVALRDALEHDASGTVGTNGVYNITATDHNGLDKRARVMVHVVAGDWKLVP